MGKEDTKKPQSQYQNGRTPWKFQKGKANIEDGQKTWVGPIKEIENDTFIYGKGMLDHNRQSMVKFIEYVGNNHTRSAERSLEQGAMVLVGVSTPDLME